MLLKGHQKYGFKMEQKTSNEKKTGKFAAVRVRGLTGVRTKIQDTLQFLRLYKNNFCSVLPNNPVYLGMLKKAKDYITWGEISEETFNMLADKRGEEFKDRETDTKGKIKYNDFFMHNNKKLKKYFRLNAPKKGFGRKGIKNSFQRGGALGYRGDKINDLIKRMI